MQYGKNNAKLKKALPKDSPAFGENDGKYYDVEFPFLIIFNNVRHLENG
jgi:hypothetical protein